MNLQGVFYNEAKKITFTINSSNNSYSLSGIDGYNNDNGGFSISQRLNIVGYPYTFSLKKATDFLNISVLHIPVKIIDGDTFSTVYNDFCVEDFNGILQPAIFKREK